MSQLTLYDRLTIHELPWASFEEGMSAKSFLEPLVSEGVHHYISNVITEMKILTINKLIIPLTINEEEYENAFVCSPYTHYIKGPLEESKVINSTLLKFGINCFFNCLSKIFKWGKINKVVVINNWLFPTILQPSLSFEEVHLITDFLIKKFPLHTLQIRSLNNQTNGELLNAVKKKGYECILSRPIYLMDVSSPHIFKSNMLKKDLKLLAASPHILKEAAELSEEDLDKLIYFYRSIYIEKYSKLNSAYTKKFIKLAYLEKILSLKIFKKEDNITAVFGYFRAHGVMTMPFFGYNADIPSENGLYRLISTSLILEAKNKNYILHLSSGASSFKRLRRADQHMEYSAIYHKHVGIKKKTPWLLLKLLTPIGSHFLKKYKL